MAKKKFPLNILIVDDDEIALSILSIIVNCAAKEIYTADNAITALDILYTHKDIDLILVDIKMSSINGYELVQLIRKFNKKVVIIAQSSHDLDPKLIKILGFDDFIAKPINNKKLITLIQTIFN